MSRLIDANKLPYEDIECTDGKTYMVVNSYDVKSAPTIKAITIPDNATNGEVIMAMFPDVEVEIEGKYITLWLDEYKWLDTDYDLWNAQYEKEVE